MNHNETNKKKIPQVPSFTKQHQQITSLVFSRCGNVITSATIKGLIISYDIAKVKSRKGQILGRF